MAWLSIVTPCFNGARFLRNCLDSVRHALAGLDYEHIVVDGASTDQSLSILKQYPEVRFISEPDQGMYDALNKALRLAAGDLIGPLNTDEQYNRAGARAALDRLRRGDTDAVFGPTVAVDEHLDFLQLFKDLVIPRVVDTHWRMPVHTCSLFYRRVLWERWPYESAYRIAGDQAWFRHQMESGMTLACVREPVGIFTWHGANLSRPSPAMSAESATADIDVRSWRIRIAKHVYHFRKMLRGAYRRSPVTYELCRDGRVEKITVHRPVLRGHVP